MDDKQQLINITFQVNIMRELLYILGQLCFILKDHPLFFFLSSSDFGGAA